MRRYETFTLHTLLQGFRTSDCEWLMPDSPGALKQSHVSVTDSFKRLELLQEFLLWYFDSFLIPLLRVRRLAAYSHFTDVLTCTSWQTNFYITESGAFRNKVLYFRQDDWDTLCKPLIERLRTNTFQRLAQVCSRISVVRNTLTIHVLFPSMTRKRFYGSENWDSHLCACSQRKPAYAPLSI